MLGDTFKIVGQLLLVLAGLALLGLWKLIELIIWLIDIF
jgi:hypothetical protein